VNRSLIALAGACTLAMSAAPAFAATSLDVPSVAAAPSLDPHAPSAFGNAGSATLSFDASGGRASEPATVHVVRDGSALYVRFDVPQREQIIGFAGGDSVAIDLWPAGSGERYHLGVGLDGKHTVDSTDNTAAWETAAASSTGGYTVTMKIPLSAVGSSSHVQFTRWISTTGQLQLWSHDGGESADDLAQAGTLTFASAVGKN
jgi:hypothetical protein